MNVWMFLDKHIDNWLGGAAVILFFFGAGYFIYRLAKMEWEE